MDCSSYFLCPTLSDVKTPFFASVISGLTLCGCCLGFHALAYGADNKPNAGALLRDMPATSGSTDKNQGKQSIEPLTDPGFNDPQGFDVSRLVIDGNTVFSADKLHELISSLEGQALTLEQLEQGIDIITRYYRSQGYPLTRALIPEQVIEDGVVHVLVLEAVWGEVQLLNSSEVVDRVIERYTDLFRPGQPVKQDELDKVSLMLSDLPGVDPQFTLKPGQVTGTTDLEVLAHPTPPVAAEWLFDNQGSRYTGKNRLSFNLQWNNPFRHGDVIGVNKLTTGDLLKYERLSFETPLEVNGWLVGVAVSDLNYRLGDNLSSSLSNGSAQQNSIWGRYQLHRSMDKNLVYRMQWDQMVLQDHQNADAIKTDRNINLWAFSLNADSTDTWLGGGRNMVSASLNLGQLNFNDAAAEATDDKSARHKGDFQRINAGASRQHYIGPNTSLLLNTDMQWGIKNLDSSQKFSLGGARSVRAYEAGTLSGDSGVLLSVELRQLLPQPAPHLNLHGQWFASVFIDAGWVKINQQPWSPGSNESGLSGVGLGLNWQGPDNWRASLSIAQPLESAPAAYVASKRTSAWFELAKGFR